jgi:predicted nucleic-acid-binding protein
VRHIIDTNCLLSFVTDRNPIQNECMAAVFERAAKLEEEILVISNVITEFVYVQLSVYAQEESLIAGMVSDLLKHPGVQYHHGFFLDSILELWPESFGEFGDAVIAAAAKLLELPVYTFDRVFRRQLERVSIPVHTPQGNTST